MLPLKSGGSLQTNLCSEQFLSHLERLYDSSFSILVKFFYRKHGQTVLRRFATYKGFRTFLTNIPEKDRIHLEKIMRKAK